jgi:predicted tellurium resistance membrane protein TerC
MWLITSLIFLVWFILKVLLHKGGYVHILLLLSLSMVGVRLMAERKTRYHKNTPGR